MKTKLPLKSKEHEEKIRQIADIIIKAGKDKIAFVILFGSFAKGNWVFDRYSEDGILYEYASDYDFLIITKTNRQANKISTFDLERKIDQELENQGLIHKYQAHNPHYVIESIEVVNDDLEKSQYFFSDIKKEGILLYNSGDFELSTPKKLDEEKRKEMAREDYEHWFDSSCEFMKIIDFDMKNDFLNKAAFHLHQATESLYSCALLALIGYKPKTHDLEELKQLCSSISPKFLTIFPKNNGNKKYPKHRSLTKSQITKLQQSSQKSDWYQLLRFAYIEARYNKNYVITKEQLQYLLGRVERLKELIRGVCGNRVS